MRKSCRGAWIIGSVLAFGAALAPAEAQALRVGVFNPQLLLENTAEGKRMQQELSALQEKKAAEIADKKKAIEEKERQLTQQEFSLSDDRRGQLMTELQRLSLDFESARDRARREIELEHATARDRFTEKLGAAVKSFGEEEDFSLLLEAGAVVWFDSAVDVTTAITDRFNKMFPGS